MGRVPDLPDPQEARRAILDDLDARFYMACVRLDEYLEASDGDELEEMRLKGKIEGVKLARDYLRAYR